jgi:hypothetical protein
MEAGRGVHRGEGCELGGGSAGDVVAGGVAGSPVRGVVAAGGSLFGAGRSGPLMPQAASVATSAMARAARARRRGEWRNIVVKS